jgi:hypothetical protein
LPGLEIANQPGLRRVIMKRTNDSMSRLIAFALLLNAAFLGIRCSSSSDSSIAEADSPELIARVDALEEGLDEILKHMSIVELPIDDKGRKAKTIRFSGVNVQVVNGAGKTEEMNGLGNLIVGYQETRPSGNVRSGSHNLVVGYNNNYSIHSGQVVGWKNTISGLWSTVSGGFHNTASGGASTVSGGQENTASGDFSTVSGGNKNTASGKLSTISGGQLNTALGRTSTVSGGQENTTSGDFSTVSGGEGNGAKSGFSIVSGGSGNTASSKSSTVSGGLLNTASGDFSTVSGGLKNKATKPGQHLPLTPR